MEDINEQGASSRREKRLKVVTICLAVIAVVLLGVLAYIWIDRNGMIGNLKTEKEELTLQLQDLRMDYNELSSNNDSLNVQLDREREKVDQLIERVQQTEATNRTKIRQYEQELGTLRSIMRHYITQIDSLNTLNTALREDAMAAREDARKSQREYNELRSTTDEYARKVEIGSVIKGRNFGLVAVMSNGKDTDRSSRTEKLKCCFFLMENDIAPKGPRRIYIRVKGPDGVVMTGEGESVFSVAGESLIYSASREVDYQGSDLEVCIFFGTPGIFRKGVYSVDVYTHEAKLGSTDVTLK
ncbi:MAG: hypothetical protein FWG54_01715 [Bacteroidetes bacterium]|nr:hypothetical protein [Bacteroidota bacterium]